MTAGNAEQIAAADRDQLRSFTSTTTFSPGGRARRSAKRMKRHILALASISLLGCATSTPPDPAQLEYRIGDIYRVKQPLLVETFEGPFANRVDKGLHLTEARKVDYQPEIYLKHPDSFKNIKGVIRPGGRLRVSRIEEHYFGIGESDWMVYARLLQPPFESEEVSLYLVSSDWDRNHYFSNGNVDSRLLNLISRQTPKQEPAGGRQPATKSVDKVPTRIPPLTAASKDVPW